MNHEKIMTCGFNKENIYLYWSAPQKKKHISTWNLLGRSANWNPKEWWIVPPCNGPPSCFQVWDHWNHEEFAEIPSTESVIDLRLKDVFSGQISSRPHTSEHGPQMVVIVREIPLFQENPGWWNIITCPVFCCFFHGGCTNGRFREGFGIWSFPVVLVKFSMNSHIGSLGRLYIDLLIFRININLSMDPSAGSMFVDYRFLWFRGRSGHKNQRIISDFGIVMKGGTP